MNFISMLITHYIVLKNMSQSITSTTFIDVWKITLREDHLCCIAIIIHKRNSKNPLIYRICIDLGFGDIGENTHPVQISLSTHGINSWKIDLIYLIFMSIMFILSQKCIHLQSFELQVLYL